MLLLILALITSVSISISFEAFHFISFFSYWFFVRFFHNIYFLFLSLSSLQFGFATFLQKFILVYFSPLNFYLLILAPFLALFNSPNSLILSFIYFFFILSGASSLVSQYFFSIFYSKFFIMLSFSSP